MPSGNTEATCDAVLGRKFKLTLAFFELELDIWRLQGNPIEDSCPL